MVSSRGPLLCSGHLVAGDDSALSNIRKHLGEVVAALRHALVELSSGSSELATLQDQKRTESAKIEEHSRALRRRLEELDDGLGAIAREVGALREKQGQLAAIQNTHDEKIKQVEDLSRRRGETYRSLDRTLDLQFQNRQLVAQQLNQELGPSIRASVTRAADVGGYVKCDSIQPCWQRPALQHIGSTRRITYVAPRARDGCRRRGCIHTR